MNIPRICRRMGERFWQRQKNQSQKREMAGVVLPDQRDVKSVISDYFDALVSKAYVPANRAQIIGNCEKPFVLFIRAAEMARAGGEMEEIIFFTFMCDILEIRNEDRRAACRVRRSSTTDFAIGVPRYPPDINLSINNKN